ncbi:MULTISPECIES: cell wall hydrolase [unclassified Novosphingobium]|uniref:cell wall hydrolase n=1 Tax=unclassified Novosphingobium TaxID=2644732 RepID=UPI00135B8B25|nr:MULTISPECIES: cell wall hydrolase [unclassified Novosphingobium]
MAPCHLLGALPQVSNGVLNWRERGAIALALVAWVSLRRLTAAVMLSLTLALVVTLLLSGTLLPGQPSAASRLIPERRGHALPGYHAAPGTNAPKIEPLLLADVDPNTARELNKAIPFAALGTDRALPFRMPPDSAEFARARDCLASVVLYEAGSNRERQAAVAQVVLNRVRHPAYPHSVCGVVYQGSERATGCQFTFTCDGALARIPSPSTWQHARATASAFLTGETDPAVGMATHYHTDWVLPYWSATLDKIARVDTHLFFRWRGDWGRQRAFTSPVDQAEPFEPKLAFLSPAHRGAATSPSTIISDLSGQAGLALAPDAKDTLSPREGDHFISIDAEGDGARLAMLGLGQCEGQAYCKVVGWDRASQGFGSPQNPVIRTVAFLYVTDKRTGVEIVLWDCARFNRPSNAQCLSDANRRWISFKGDLSHAS